MWILPHDEALRGLGTAVSVAQHDEWQTLAKRCLPQGSKQRLLERVPATTLGDLLKERGAVYTDFVLEGDCRLLAGHGPIRSTGARHHLFPARPRQIHRVLRRRLRTISDQPLQEEAKTGRTGGADVEHGDVPRVRRPQAASSRRARSGEPWARG